MMTLKQIQEACEWMDRAARDLRMIPEGHDRGADDHRWGQAQGFEEAARFLRALALKCDQSNAEEAHDQYCEEREHGLNQILDAKEEG